MTVAELIGLLNDMTDRENPTEEALRWFNACSRRIAPQARIPQISESTIPVPFSRFSLPEDLVEIVQPDGLQYQPEGKSYWTIIYDRHLHPNKVTGYRRFGKVVVLDSTYEPGTLRLDYYRLPDPLTSLDDEPEIPEAFHEIYAYYGAMLYLSRWSNQGEDYPIHRAEFERLLNELDLHTSYQRGRGAPFQTRDVMPRWKSRRRVL